ncbi:hypothetical protein CC85DRAFT_33709 [Cutaneotrichosporon oleaginosum]|uniref:Uncharacterized protein n=1 Tax=Cutaneotrichosporon oleaginosum TaxID=879819 RepID=A0A0J0XBJ4_9TREE|nr:uncharacterized protein CC85DRAFT_33709 [Cutaneotrichosporon oleaginosum]KLT38440.1 hypothetical protein CC85DRAFT_33709 [Cutaneotrichosporon oleaginosum]TXT09374.1 hypothetical protein COLE_03308 [Cutaneotrichosporon oleaginosum]
MARLACGLRLRLGLEAAVLLAESTPPLRHRAREADAHAVGAVGRSTTRRKQDGEEKVLMHGRDPGRQGPDSAPHRPRTERVEQRSDQAEGGHGPWARRLGDWGARPVPGIATEFLRIQGAWQLADLVVVLASCRYLRLAATRGATQRYVWKIFVRRRLECHVQEEALDAPSV